MIDHITRLRAEEAGLPAAESHPDPLLVSLPLRCDWEQTRLLANYPGGVPYAYQDNSGEYAKQYERLLNGGPAQFPPPLVGATERSVDTWPGPVEQLAALAATLGWNLKVTYAHGFTPHGTTGKPSAMSKESWAIRLHRGDERAVAVRMAGAWSSFWYWSPDTLMRRSDTLIDFRARLYPQAVDNPVSFPVDQA